MQSVQITQTEAAHYMDQMFIHGEYVPEIEETRLITTCHACYGSMAEPEVTFTPEGNSHYCECGKVYCLYEWVIIHIAIVHVVPSREFAHIVENNNG